MNLCRLLCVLILVITLRPGDPLAGEVPTVGHQLVSMRLETPLSTASRDYLGLSASETFDPLDITGRLLVIEIFSMYCPHCQREAPAVNRLYQAIEASEHLRGQVKMIGIGVGNSDFEINHFRKHYQIAFPLFPDEDFEIHQSLGEVRTPFFIIVAEGSTGKGKILWTGAGHLEPLETVIDRLKALLN